MSEQTRVQTDPRISRRRAAVQRSKRRRLLIASGSVVVAAAILWTLFFSPLLGVRDVKVIGAQRSGADKVSEATGLLSGDDNLLLLSTGEIEDRVRVLPWVKDVKVQRSLPGTVKVEVMERKPGLLLSLGRARWTIDEQGNVLQTGAAEPGLPTLAGVEVATVEPGVRLRTEEAGGALQVYRALPNGLKAKIAAVFAPTVERITLSLMDGTAVRFGAAEEIPAKVKVLKSLLARLAGEGRHATYIDVRVPTSPAIAPLQSASPSPTASPGAPTPSPSP